MYSAVMGTPRFLLSLALLVPGALFAACSLNPQPEPPNETESATPAPGGSGGAKPTGAGGSSGAANGKGGSLAGSAGKAGGGETGGAVGIGGTSSGGAAGSAKAGAGGTPGGLGGAGGSSAGGTTQTGTGGGAGAAAGGVANPSGGSTGLGGGAGGSSTAGTGGSSTAGTGGSSTGGAGGSSSGGGGQGGSGGSAQMDACNALATSWCDRWSTCAPFASTTAFGSSSTCVTQTTAWCLVVTSEPDMPPPSDTANCASVLAAASCDDLLVAGTPWICIPATPGPRADASPCTADAQCASGFCDAVPGGCGTCAARPVAGDPCPTAASCGMGLVCESSSGTCIPFKKLGDACTSDCSPTLWCNSGTCAALGDVGAACTGSPIDCDYTIGLDCISGHCTAVTTATSGGTCGMAVTCTDATYCDYGASLSSGTCKPSVEVGGACDPTGMDPCMEPATCDPSTGACTIPMPACP